VRLVRISRTRISSTVEAMTLFGGHQTMLGLRPMLLKCGKPRCVARYVEG
jgi:hypothetical protein